MDRQIVYPGAIPLETDILNTNRNVLTGIGALIQDLFGTNTIFSGLGCVATSPASMSVTINPGRVYSLQYRDPVSYSSLGQDVTNQIMKQGILLAAQSLACAAPLTSGFSQNYLVSAAFIEADVNPVVLPYYNASNPQQAFSGPPVGGVSSGTAQNTTRQDTVALTLTPGIAAATGTQTTPATPVGTTPLWVVTVAYGQTTITAANISAVAGSPFVPTGGYLAAVGERFNSVQNVSASSTLTTAALGALVNITATGTTQTLPPAASCPNGTSVSLAYMQSSGSATVARNGTDTLSFGQGNSASSLTLSPGEEVQFVSNGANGWVSAGQTLSTGVTPPALDNSTKLQTSAGANAIGPVVGTVRNLFASISTSASSATFTADEVIVESALGGAPLRLANVTQTINISTVGAGGMDTGSPPVTGYVGIYLIYNPATNTRALLATNATTVKPTSVYSGASMPSGYTASALIAIWPTTTSLLYAGAVVDRYYHYDGNIVVYNASGSVAAFTAVSVSSGVPLGARYCSAVITGSCTSTDAGCLNGVAGSAGGIGQKQWNFVTAGASTSEGITVENIPLITAQTLYLSCNTNSGTPGLSLAITGFSF